MKSARASSVERAASLWVARHALGPLSREDDQAFERWCGEDPCHRPCFDRLRGVLAQADGAEVELRRAHERALAREAMVRRRRLGGVAAGLSVIAVSAGLWLASSTDLRTGRGQVAAYRLADGSRVWLDANSAVDVEINGNGRRLTLREGRIHVAVAHEARPFSVAAAGREIVDIGTEFDVALEGAGGSAFVTKGEVAIADVRARTLLTAGQGVHWLKGGKLNAADPADAQEALGWRKGELVFHRRPLRDVIAVLDRYSRKRLWLTNAASGDRLVSGVVRANEIGPGLASIAKSQGLATQDWGFVVILR